MAMAGGGARRGTGPPHDGRAARGARTRIAIVEATIELIESGNTQPSTREVAERAGVSVRLLFHHFEDVPLIFRSAAALRSSRSRSLIGMIPPRGPVDLRIRAICHQRRELFEAIAPVLLATLARTSDLHDVLGDLRSLLRQQLLVSLRPEILAHGRSAPVLLESLDQAAGWQNWHSLRSEAGRSAGEAEQVMVYTVTVLLR
jgi:AcrR family transcriptional regulator